MKKLIIILVLLISVLELSAQKDVKSRKEIKAKKAAEVKEQISQLVESKNFEYIPYQVTPSTGKTLSISAFSLDVKNDSVLSYLPYYGVAYTSEYGSNKSPLNFKLPAKDYSEKKTKNGYQIEMKIDKNNEEITYYFRISYSGLATLNVLSTGRRPISFYGRIEPIEQ